MTISTFGKLTYHVPFDLLMVITILESIFFMIFNSPINAANDSKDMPMTLKF